MTMGVNSSPTGDTPALSAATVDMVGQSRPAVQAWQSAAVRSGEFKSETSMLPALQPHPADGGEIFIGGTLWKQSTTLPRCTKFRNSQSVLKLTSFPKSWSLFLAGTSCIEKLLPRPGIGLAEHDIFSPFSLKTSAQLATLAQPNFGQ